MGPQPPAAGASSFARAAEPWHPRSRREPPARLRRPARLSVALSVQRQTPGAAARGTAAEVRDLEGAERARCPSRTCWAHAPQPQGAVARAFLPLDLRQAPGWPRRHSSSGARPGQAIWLPPRAWPALRDRSDVSSPRRKGSAAAKFGWRDSQCPLMRRSPPPPRQCARQAKRRAAARQAPLRESQ